MKKFTIVLVFMLACFTLLSGCTDKKGDNDQDVNVGNSVEIDDADLEIDAEKKPDAEDNSDIIDLPDGFTYTFKDPDNADGIVVTPKG